MTTLLTRREGALLAVGGPTVVVDVAGLRFVTDPTFDQPGEYGDLRKTRGPAVSPSSVADADVVLISHADHADNLDHAGREFALAAPRVLTCVGSARLLGGETVGMSAWSSIEVAPDVRVLTVPALHGPADGERDARGFVTCEVVGFVIQARGTSVYVSGDNTSLAHVAAVRRHVGVVDHAVLHAGRARHEDKQAGRPLTLTAHGAAAAAQILEAPHVMVVNDTGWEHFTQGPWSVVRAFREAGIIDRLDRSPLGQWSSVAFQCVA